MIRVVPIRALVALVYMGLMLALSSLPGRQVARLGLPVDLLNLLHVPLYAGLAWVTLSALVGPTLRRMALAVGACLAFAISDEWYQSVIPGRVAALEDLMADGAGIALGIAVREGIRPAVLALRGTRQ